MNKKTVLEFQNLKNIFLLFQSNTLVWGINTDRRNRHASQIDRVASYALKRIAVSFALTHPSELADETKYPKIKIDGVTLEFQPYGIVCSTKLNTNVYKYSDLKINYSTEVYLEDAAIPKDVEVIGHISKELIENKKAGQCTWQGKTKTIPLCIYAYLDFELKGYVFSLMHPSVENAKKLYDGLLNYQKEIYQLKE